MPKGLKIMLFFTLALPIISTILIIFVDYILGKDIQLLSYSAAFLGAAAGGLIFGGPLYYLILKSKEE